MGVALRRSLMALAIYVALMSVASPSASVNAARVFDRRLLDDEDFVDTKPTNANQGHSSNDVKPSILPPSQTQLTFQAGSCVHYSFDMVFGVRRPQHRRQETAGIKAEVLHAARF